MSSRRRDGGFDQRFGGHQVDSGGFSSDSGGFGQTGGGFSQVQGGGAGAAWSPLDLLPSLWLKADVGVTLSGSDVSSWADQSGNGNTATGTVARLPLYLATGGPNSSPTIEFDGGSLEQMTFAGFAVPANGTMVLVHRTTAVGLLGYNAFLYTTGGPAVYIQHDTSDRPALQWSGAERNPGPASVVDSAWHSGRWMWGATNLAYATDNAADTTVARGGLTESGNYTQLGCVDTALNTFSRFSEIIVFPAELSAGSITSLNSYLSTRFGIW